MRQAVRPSKGTLCARRWATAVILAGALVLTGCNGAQPAGPGVTSPSALGPATVPFGISTPTTTPPAPPVDYRDLLLQPEDMVLPNAGYSVPQPATLNPQGIPGAEVMITSDDATNAVGITIVVLDDADDAPAELSKAVSGLVTVTPSGPPVRLPVGDDAVAITGATPDGMKSATALLFRRGRALVRIDFYGEPGTPTPMATVADIGQKQSAAIRVGLPATMLRR